MNKINILFVCLGNICRSPMAEYIAKDFVKNNNINNVEISSAGTANYHQGEFMHRGTDKVLTKYNIAHSEFRSRQITKTMFDQADYIFVMDNSNYRDLIDRFKTNNKIKKITDYCQLNYSEVPDPWYSGNFDETYEILINSVENLFKSIL